MKLDEKINIIENLERKRIKESSKSNWVSILVKKEILNKYHSNHKRENYEKIIKNTLKIYLTPNIMLSKF